MLDAIKSFFTRHADPGEEPGSGEVHAPPAGQRTGPDPIQVAACALMLELAHADDEFTDEEQDHIHESLMRHFALPSDTAREMMALAERERRQAVDLYQFTSLIAQRYDEGQKMVLAEIMWRLVYSDGRLAKHEDYLMRKVSNLLDLRPGYLAEARRKIMEEDAS
jgi:uncharacterized tellurite resistance protein B-like protein